MRIIRYFLLITAFTLSTFSGSVEIRVNTTRVSEGERLDVKIVAQGKDVNFPVIDSVDGFRVENSRTSQKSQMRIIDEKITQKSETVLTFSLYPDRNITIPKFEVNIDGKKYSTKEIKIEMVKNQTKGGLSNNFKITSSVEKRMVSVGEPIIFKVDVIEPNSSGSAVAQLNYIPPNFKGFFVKQIGGENLVRKADTTVHELKYLLIPQKRGKFTIPPAGLRVGLEDLNTQSDPFGLFETPIKWYSMRSKPITISVESAPKGVDLIGNFKVTSKVDKERTKPNQPINYTLKIEGVGSLEDMEDPVFDIPNVTVYSDNAVVKSKLVNGKLISTYTKKYVFISNASFIIPEIKLKEFDYTTKKIRELKGEGFSIAVEGSPQKNFASANSTNHSSISFQHSTPKKGLDNNSSILEDTLYYAKKEYEEKEAMLPFYTLSAFLAGMMAMFALMKLFKSSKVIRNLLKKEKKVLFNYTTKEALDILYPYTSDSEEIEDMVKKLYLVHKGKRAMHIIDKNKLHKMIEKYS
jgi:hypothetical protein